MSDDEAKRLAQEQSHFGPQPGQIFRHYKGGLYTIVARSVKEDTLEPLVTYLSNRHGTNWTRTLANFEERLCHSLEYQGGGPRFKRIKDLDPSS